MANLNKLAINQLTNDPVKTDDLLNIYGQLGVPSITPWRSKLEEHNVTPGEFKKIADETGIEVNGFCLCGFYGSKGKEGRQAQIDDNKKTIDMAVAAGATSIVTLAGEMLPDTKDLDYSKKFNMEALSEVLEYARQAGVKLGLEPLHPMYTADWSVVVSIKEANDWCDQLGDGIGIIVDAYHVWWDPELEQEIQRAGKENRIVAAHVSDWLVPTKDILLDRGIMGDGVIDIQGIRAWLENAGYQGRYEVEIFSNDYWKMDQREYTELIMQRFKQYV
ncbi:MAG: sugar phosphate isomerase/epimerase family protein [Gammaproteobacteria bacterium]